MAKVEAAIDPDATVVHFDVVLRANGPLALGGDPFSLYAWVSREERCGGW